MALASREDDSMLDSHGFTAHMVVGTRVTAEQRTSLFPEVGNQDWLAGPRQGEKSWWLL